MLGSLYPQAALTTSSITKKESKPLLIIRGNFCVIFLRHATNRIEQTMRDIHTELAGLNEEAAALAKTIQKIFEEIGI